MPKRRHLGAAKRTIVGTLIVAGAFLFLHTFSFAQSIDFGTSEQIKNLNKEISEKANLVESLDDKAGQLAELIAEKQEEATTLENELAIIKNRIAKLELDLQKREAQIEKTNLSIEQIQLQIAQKQGQIDFQKAQIASLIREINRQDVRSRLEILLLNDSLSKFFSYVQQLEDVESNLSVSLAGLLDSQRALEIEQHEVETEKVNLQKLLLELEIEKQKLDEERANQERVIEQTKLSEREFQKNLSEIRFQQRVANEEIQKLELEIKEKLRQAKLNNPNFQLNPGQLLWPIPNQGITTTFHDPSYPFRHIVGEHSGLDLRTLKNGVPQMGLPVRAPAAGVTVKTIRNGRFTGNAIFLSHGDLMTVFLHLSEMYVKVDQYSEIGETIGLTGGAPGHPGAGLSSGPHLHFEVRKDGIPVNPCNYLTPGC